LERLVLSFVPISGGHMIIQRLWDASFCLLQCSNSVLVLVHSEVCIISRMSLSACHAPGRLGGVETAPRSISGPASDKFQLCITSAPASYRCLAFFSSICTCGRRRVVSLHISSLDLRDYFFSFPTQHAMSHHPPRHTDLQIDRRIHRIVLHVLRM
jgi:hypothetical protein